MTAFKNGITGMTNSYIREKLGIKRYDATGSVQTITIKTTGEYKITAVGASGSGGNIYGTSYFSKGGKGASVVGTFQLTAGDILKLIIGKQGTCTSATSKDGTSGGGGGGTFVFKDIISITNSKYQYTKSNQPFEVLIAAAGGGGDQDCAYKGATIGGYDGIANPLYTPNNYTAPSTTTNAGTSSTAISSVLGVQQYISYNSIGAFYTRNNGKGQGGYGGGSATDDTCSYGGGWNGSNYKAYSFSSDNNAVGTNGVNDGDGYIIIEMMAVTANLNTRIIGITNIS